MAVTNYANFNIADFDKDTVFVLDTNVLYFVHSGYYLPSDSKCIAYSNMIQQIMLSGFKIYISALSLQELYFGIENKEYIKYYKSNRLNPRTFTKKDFRAISTERAKVKSKLNLVKSELSMYEIRNGYIATCVLDEFLSKYDSHTMDPVDYIFTKNYSSPNVVFITGDRDFLSLPTINILTV